MFATTEEHEKEEPGCAESLAWAGQAWGLPGLPGPWVRSAWQQGAPGMSAGTGSGLPDVNASTVTGNYGKSVIFLF